MALSDLSVAIVSIVALISLALTIITLMGWRRTRNRKIGFIAGAFFTHFLKSSLVALSIQFSVLGHEAIESTEAVFDLVMMVLLFIPFILRA